MDVIGFLLGLGALIYVLRVEHRRREDSEKLTRNIAALIQRVHALEERPQQANQAFTMVYGGSNGTEPGRLPEIHRN